jgi:hypothetical protein
VSESQSPRLSRRGFVTTAVTAGLVATGGVVGAERLVHGGQSRAATTPDEQWPITASGRSTQVRKGDLIVADQKNGTVYQVRGNQATEIASFKTWSNGLLFSAVASPRSNRLWASITGLGMPSGSIYYGVHGVGRILQMDLSTGKLERVFAAKELVDPAGLLLTDDDRTLYVSDFNSFGTEGRVLRVDLASGKVEVVTEGGHLTTPVGINGAGGDKVVVGSALMPEVNPAGTGGRVVEVDVRTGRQTVVHEHERRHGSLIGAAKLADGTYMATRSDWPNQGRSAVFATAGGSDFRVLSQPTFAFFGSGMAPTGDGAWVTESTQRQLQHLLPDGRVTQRIQLPGARVERLLAAEDTLESVSMVS